MFREAEGGLSRPLFSREKYVTVFPSGSEILEITNTVYSLSMNKNNIKNYTVRLF